MLYINNYQASDRESLFELLDTLRRFHISPHNMWVEHEGERIPLEIDILPVLRDHYGPMIEEAARFRSVPIDDAWDYILSPKVEE